MSSTLSCKTELDLDGRLAGAGWTTNESLLPACRCPAKAGNDSTHSPQLSPFGKWGKGVRDSSGLKCVGRVAPMEKKRKQRRRPPRKVLKRLKADELMQESEFRRWRYHAPDGLKRQAYEIIRQLVAAIRGSPAEPGRK